MQLQIYCHSFVVTKAGACSLSFRSKWTQQLDYWPELLPLCKESTAVSQQNVKFEAFDQINMYKNIATYIYKNFLGLWLKFLLVHGFRKYNTYTLYFWSFVITFSCVTGLYMTVCEFLGISSNIFVVIQYLITFLEPWAYSIGSIRRLLSVRPSLSDASSEATEKFQGNVMWSLFE